MEAKENALRTPQLIAGHNDSQFYIVEQISGEMDFKQWASMGRNMQNYVGKLHFWIGDWINFGLRKFCRKDNETGKFVASDAYKEALNATGLEQDTLRNLAWVSGAVAPGVRLDGLSWTHHREVAGLVAAKQRHWLRLAEAGANGVAWSVSELRMAIRGSQKLIDEGGERELELIKWAKPADDLVRYLKQEDNEQPIEEWSDDKKQAVRTALKDVKAIVDRLWGSQ